MAYSQALIAAKLRRWEKYLMDFNLPSWDELPAFELYIDQVVALVGQYLNFLPADEHGNPAITASTVNNYVRLRLMPPPQKKRYGRLHVVYLIMICTLKQSMSMAHMQKLIPAGLPEDAVRALYGRYAATHKRMCRYFVCQVRENAQDILHSDSEEPALVDDLLFGTAIVAGFSRLLTEKILRLPTLEEGTAPPAQTSGDDPAPADS